MASSALKGIATKIGGDATELAAALKKIDSVSAGNRSALKEVESSLRSNAYSLVLLGQKQEHAGRWAETGMSTLGYGGRRRCGRRPRWLRLPFCSNFLSPMAEISDLQTLFAFPTGD